MMLYSMLPVHEFGTFSLFISVSLTYNSVTVLPVTEDVLFVKTPAFSDCCILRGDCKYSYLLTYLLISRTAVDAADSATLWMPTTLRFAVPIGSWMLSVTVASRMAAAVYGRRRQRYNTGVGFDVTLISSVVIVSATRLSPIHRSPSPTACAQKYPLRLRYRCALQSARSPGRRSDRLY